MGYHKENLSPPIPERLTPPQARCTLPLKGVPVMRAITRTALCIGIWLSLAGTAPAQDLVLVEDGKSPYRIMVALDATMQEYYAAQQLQRYVKEMTGAELPIVGDDNALGDTRILVGFNRHLERLGLEVDRESFGPEEFLIRTAGRHLVILGGSPRGVPYGVNSLLTEEWGCRWFTPTLRRIPKRERLTLPPTDRRYAPPFEWREAGFWSSLDNEWAFHNFQTADFSRLRLEQGGRSGIVHSPFVVHTALLMVPPELYREEHPDYFWGGDKRSGRSRDRNMGPDDWVGLCLTHPDVPKIAAQTLLDFHREQQGEGDLYYSVSAGDFDDWCECPRCLAFYRSHGQSAPGPARGPGHGAAWLQFAARVQEELEGKPDAPKLSLLAYGYHNIPPSEPKRHEGLNVLYAEGNNLCQIHPIDHPTCWRNQMYRENLDGWLKCGESTYVWLYKVNFGYWCYVHPNMDTFADDLRYLRKVGVTGIYAQANRMGWAGRQFWGEMNDLRPYLLARLLWNPDLDWRELRREFCAAYYGEKAGAVIQEYLDDVRKAFVEQGVHSYSGLNPEDFHWITPEMFARWYATIDKAESLAEDEEHKRLVRIARLPVQFTQGCNMKDPDERRAALQSYLDNARQLGASGMIGIGESLRVWAGRQGLAW